jgi:hypothetical protein
MKEYELCFVQMRFYGERHEKLLSYTFNTLHGSLMQFRGYLMNVAAPGFKNNRLYTSFDLPALTKSVQGSQRLHSLVSR